MSSPEKQEIATPEQQLAEEIATIFDNAEIAREAEKTIPAYLALKKYEEGMFSSGEDGEHSVRTSIQEFYWLTLGGREQKNNPELSSAMDRIYNAVQNDETFREEYFALLSQNPSFDSAYLTKYFHELCPDELLPLTLQELVDKEKENDFEEVYEALDGALNEEQITRVMPNLKKLFEILKKYEKATQKNERTSLHDLAKFLLSDMDESEIPASERIREALRTEHEFEKAVLTFFASLIPVAGYGYTEKIYQARFNKKLSPPSNEEVAEDE